MEKLNKKSKIIIVLIILIIIAGITITATKGLNFSLRYQQAKKVELYLQKEFEIADVKKIVNEVMPDQYAIVEKVEVFEDSVNIIAKDITDEQKNELVTKINEKYELELSADNTEVESISRTRLRDIVKPYVGPFIISTVLVLVYFAIRYNKLNPAKVIVKSICSLIIIQALFISLIAITRIPVGVFTMPVSILIYVATLFVLATKFDKSLEKIEENDKKSKKNKK